MMHWRKLSLTALFILIFPALMAGGCDSGGLWSGDGGDDLVSFWGELGNGPGQMDAPAGFCLSGRGTLLIADTNNHRIEEFTNKGDFIGTWGEEGDGPGQFSYPSAVAVDSVGNIYVADTLNNRIQKFGPSYKFLLQWGTEGNAIGQLLVPFDLAIDSQDNVYVADSGNSRIQKFASHGELLASWGEKGAGPGQLQHPGGVAVSQSGQIYVADSDNHRVQVFSKNGNFLTAWGRQGDDPGEMFNPLRLKLDSQENVFVVDTGNGRIQKFSTGGTYMGEWSPDGGFLDIVDVIPDFPDFLLLDQDSPRIYDINPLLLQPKERADIPKQPKPGAPAAGGGNALETPVPKDRSTWMADNAVTIQDKALRSLVIPGTHDTGTYAITNESAWAHDGNPNHAKQAIELLNKKLGKYSKLLKPFEPIIYKQAVNFQSGWSKSQNLDMEGQLKGGIRYFDFRVSWEPAANDNGEYSPEGFYLVHSMRGASLKSALDELRNFCRQNPKEIILLDVNHMYYDNTNGGMTTGMLAEFDKMIVDTLVYEDETSMLVETTDWENVTVKHIWSQGRQILAFVSDSRLHEDFPVRYWKSNEIRSVWDNTDSLKNLRSFLEGEMTHCDDGLHISQCQRTETQTDIINGALTWLYKDELHGHTTTQRIVKYFANKYGYSVDSARNLLEFSLATLADISKYLGWIGFDYQGPKIQIINGFGGDQYYSWWLYENGFLKADDYVDFAIKLNVKYYGDGGPKVWLAHKVTLPDTTYEAPGFGPIHQPQITDYEGFLVYAATNPRGKIVVRAMSENNYPEPSVWLDEYTGTFPTAAKVGDRVMIAWPAEHTRHPTYTTTQDGTHFTAVVTDANEKVESDSVAMMEFDGDLVSAWRYYEEFDAKHPVVLKRYTGGDPSKPFNTMQLVLETKYGPYLAPVGDVFWTTAVRDSGSFYLIEQYFYDQMWGFKTGKTFDQDQTDDSVSIATIYGYIVLAWRGGGDNINLYVKGLSEKWYKRVLPEKTLSTPSISFVKGINNFPDRLFLVWRGIDNHINSAVIEGL